MATKGAWSRILINGQEIGGDTGGSTFKLADKANPTIPEGSGFQQYVPGHQILDYSIANGYRRRGQGLISAWNLLYPSGVGNVNDTEFIIAEPRGNNAAPVVGDVGVIGSFTRLPITPKTDPEKTQNFDASFKARGKLSPPFPVLIYDNSAIKTATSFNSTPYDDGAEGNGTVLGAEAVFQVYSPTGVAATGTFSLSGQPSDGDTVTINGTVYTFKTALTPTAGQVLIGSNAADTLKNLWYAMMGVSRYAGTKYAAGTTAVPSTTVIISIPTATTITFTYATTGTAGNDFTLAKTGTNLAVSGATLSGGVAGDTYNVALATATSSGGSYTTHVTWSGVGAVRAAYYSEIAIGTTINEWWRLTFTLASGAGTSQTFAGMCMVGRFFNI